MHFICILLTTTKSGKICANILDYRPLLTERSVSAYIIQNTLKRRQCNHATHSLKLIICNYSVTFNLYKLYLHNIICIHV